MSYPSLRQSDKNENLSRGVEEHTTASPFLPDSTFTEDMSSARATAPYDDASTGTLVTLAVPPSALAIRQLQETGELLEMALAQNRANTVRV